MLVLIRPDLPVADLGPLPAEIELVVLGDRPDAEQLARAEVVIPAFGAAVAEWLGDMPALRLVLVTSAGYDWIAPHVPRGVVLANARGARDAAVAEWVLAAILAMEKDLLAFRASQVAGRWDYRPAADLAGRTVLILGAGTIGGAVEARLRPFGVGLLRVARTARPGVHPAAELPRLLRDTQILVILLPGGPDTRHLVDAALLAHLPDGALVVNAGRGSVLDPDALLGAVRRRGLRAALDVTEPEPLPEGHPLWAQAGVLITPHVAGDSPRAERAAHRLAGAQLRAYAGGEPVPHAIEREASGPRARS